MNIDTLESGEEMDALIAENVFGRLVTWNRAFQYTTDEERKEDPYIHAFLTIPEYSTNLTAAWKIVEELQSRHFYVDIRTCSDFYEVWITKHESGDTTSTFAHPRLPFAICKAALAAIESTEQHSEAEAV